MSRFKEHLASIAGVEIYPIISLLIFFLFFVALITYVVLVKKDYINQMSQIPLKDDLAGGGES